MAESETGMFGPNVDEEINKTWRQVEERVIQMAGGDRTKIQSGLTIENVLQHLDKAQTTDKMAAERYSTIRNIFNRTLQCIQTVGGIVADGASYAFAPAGTCYCALTFVISAWQGYEGIFESLASLLEKCTEFLDRLGYYAQSGMDSKLTKVACQHLQIFVDICDRSLKMKSKRHKFAAFMKQMFLNDDGVQDLLGAMKNLIDKERGLVAAQTWKSSNDAASYSKDGLNLTRKLHNTLVDDKNQLKREKEVQKWKQSIIDALELDRKIIDDENFDWEKAWKRQKSKILEGSGDWLVENSHFRDWMTETDTSSRILGLEGGDGAGKTLLASNVILHLRKLKSVGSSRAIVAHNFLEADSKSATPIDTAVAISRHLMCQLAFGDEPFMKSVASICEKSKYFDSALDMWSQLLLENEDLENIDVTFFVVFDGLGANVDTFTQILQKFSQNPLIKRTRILLTGQPEIFNAIEKAGVEVKKIVLGEPNKRDMELYINHQMGNMEILKDESRPGVSDMREKILKELLESTQGDYYKVNRVLDNISKTDDVEEINSFLETAGDARPDQIEADIENLNQTRTAKEIAEINEIILWIWAAKSWLSPLEMEAALALKAGNKGGTSLMPMESKIKSKYTIFTTEYNIVAFKDYEIQDKIPYRKKDARDEDSSSGFKEIQPAEINIVKHYLAAVCPPDLYQKFGFEQFFELKKVRKSSYIYQDPDNGHITMVIRCLTCLAEERNEKTELLKFYTSLNLLSHMEETDLSLADRSLKSEAGEKLVKLFTEMHGLDSLFSFHGGDLPTDDHQFSISSIWDNWIIKNDGVEAIAKWFNDSAVIEKVKDNPLVAAFKASGANRHLVLYETAMNHAAGDLFVNETTKGETFDAFVLLCSLLAKKDEKFIWDTEKAYQPTLEMVQAVEDWAQEILGITEKDSNWEAQAAALLVILPGEHIPSSAPAERARKALELDPTNWGAYYALFLANKSPEESANLEGIIKKLMRDSKWLETKQHKGILARMMFDLGDRYWETNDTPDKAIAIYSKVLAVDKSYSIIKPFGGILEKYASKSKWDEIISFLEILLQNSTGEENLAGNFIGNGLWRDSRTFRQVLAGAIGATNRYELLEALIEKSKEVMDQRGPLVKFFLRLYHGDILADNPGHEEEAITLWENLIANAVDDEKNWSLSPVVAPLVSTYMKLMSKDGTTPEQAETYDKKVQSYWDLFDATNSPRTELCVTFAQYYRARGRDNLMMKVLKTPAKEALEMLYDDDEENDSISYWLFSLIFAATHDSDNNMVAWHMMEQAQQAQLVEYEKKLEAWKEAQNAPKGEGDANDKAEAESEPFKPDKVLAFCDGCRKNFESPTGFWVCLTEGGQTHLCDDCYVKLKDGTLEGDHCGKDHEHLHIVRDEEKIATVPRGSVLSNGNIITLEEWKQAIKKKYVEVGE